LLEKPAMAYAYRLAKRRRAERCSFRTYLTDRLSEEAKVIWKRLQTNDSSQRQEVLRFLKSSGVKLRQELFLHALFSSKFNLSEALRITGLKKPAVEKWIDTDPEFRKLVAEVQWHKKNFFEDALISLVGAKDPAAVIFANKTLNADRGYSEKIQIQTNHEPEFSIEELDLDIDTKRRVLEAIKKKKLKSDTFSGSLAQPVGFRTLTMGNVIDVSPSPSS
jgi:hypothetical protein